MRKNHHGKKDRLVKRVFALCLALAVICTCLVPVFATEYKEVVDSGDEVAGFGGDEAAGFGEPREVYDDSEAAGFGEEEATRPVEGGEDNPGEGGTVKETEWGTVIEYDTSTSTSTDPSSSTVTQWSGEDDVVEKPDDKVVVSGDEIKKLQDMVVYRFWLKELNTLDLQDITAQAQINNMTESEYLARNGEVLWNLYFIQAVPRAETIADYSSYIENPSSNRDPKGELRQFDYWYTLDEFGNRVRLNLTDPTSNILDNKTTTVNVYAAWKDGTVGSDEEEDVDHEDLVDKNPVPVDLTAKASASYEDEEGNPKTTTLPVEVKNLPSAAHSLSVIHMGDDDMESFYESHEDSFGEMMPILGLKISPKNAKGETVQPAKGQKATVTVSGLDALPEMEGATASTLKVLHETSDGNVEILDVLTYTNGTLTFETSGFSPFVVVRTDGYAVDTLDINNITKVSIKDDIANSGHYILQIIADGKDYEGADAGTFLHEHGYKVTWKQNETVAKRTEVSDGLFTLEKNGGWIDVIYTDGANKTYVVTVSNDTEAKSSSGKTVEYNKRLENGDFEQGGANQTLEGTPGLVWKTTANDHYIELANIGDGQSYRELQYVGGKWTTNDAVNYGGIAFGATSTPNGTHQFAELNAKQEGALYQDVLTKPGLTMNWKFSHKARTRTNSGSGPNSQNNNVLMPSKKTADTMAMVIAPLELVGNIETQSDLVELLARCGNSSGEHKINGYGTHGDPKKEYRVYVVYDSSEIHGYTSKSMWFGNRYAKYNYSTSSWNNRSGTYTVPEGQYLTRFFFVAVDTVFQDGDLRVGNLLDDVWFAQEAPPAPTDGSGQITVTKKFYGLTLDEAKKVAEKGIISGDTGSISFNGDAWTTDTDARGSYIAVSHVINNLSLAANQPYQYTFTEDKEIAAVEGYTLKETLVDGKTKSEPSGTVNIDKENNLQSITFSNIYEKNTADVTLTKHVTGLMGDTHKEFVFSITGLNNSGAMLENGDLSNFTLTHNGSVTLKNVPMGTVFAVVETLGTESGYETKATGHDTPVTDVATRTFYYKLVLENGEQKLMACDANGNEAKEQEGLAITVTNHCTLQPDLGVLLDTLPYIVILAVVAGGVALLMLRKHRKEDD